MARFRALRSAAVLAALAVIAGALAASLGLGVGGAPSASHAGRFTWTSPVIVGERGPSGALDGIQAIACPSSTLCIAGDRGGTLLATDAFGPDSSWQRTAVDVSGAITALACPSARFCLLGDSAGDVRASTEPRGSTATWLSVLATHATPITTITCPSKNACLVSSGSRLASSGDPLVASSWHALQPFGGVEIAGLACTAASACVARSSAGELAGSTRPLGGHWGAVDVHAPAAAGSVTTVACLPQGPCLGGTAKGWIVPITFTPASGASSGTTSGSAIGWTGASEASHQPLAAIGCQATSCVVLDASGTIHDAPIRRTSNGGGALTSPWRVVAVDPALRQASVTGQSATVACNSAGCEVVDGSAGVVSARRPERAESWRRSAVDLGHGLDTLVCPTARACLAGTTNGQILWTRTAQHRGAPWSSAEVDPGGWITSIACASLRFCAAADGSGAVLRSTQPTSADPAWTRSVADPGQTIWGISCPTAAFCAAVDGGGGILTTSDASAPSPSWHRRQVASTTIWTISCPSTQACFAGDETGQVLSSADPRGGAWRATTVSAAGIGALDCPTTDLCVAGNGAGQVLVARHPEAGRVAWAVRNHQRGSWITNVACAGTAQCVAAEDSGRILSSPSPAGRRRSWSSTMADPKQVIWAVACASTTVCLAGDFSGGVLVGRRNAA